MVLGVSGGKDSVCLLRVLEELREEFGLSLYVVHVHHGIRGADADRDAEFTMKLCEAGSVSCRVVACDVPKLAKEAGMSVEEAGRSARYQAFYDEARRVGADKIAVAHHKNDQAETVLLHLFRGTSVNGLAGIRPVCGKLVRPLLFCTTLEITGYLESIGQSYCQDASNQENVYTRNFLRNQLIPLIEERINPNVQEGLCGLAQDAAEWSAYISMQCDETQKKVLKKEEKRVTFDVDAFLMEPVVLQRELAMRGLAYLAGGRKDLGRIHVSAVIDLFAGQTGRKISLPYGIYAFRSYQNVILTLECPGIRDGERNREPQKIEVDVPGTFRLQLEKGTYDFSFSICRHQDEKKSFIENMEKKNYGCTKSFDYDRINSMLVFRHRLPGDYLVLDFSGHRQKLKDYFINEKIPKEMRDQIWVLASGSEIIWIPGYRESPGFFVGEETERILLITGKPVEL